MSMLPAALFSLAAAVASDPEATPSFLVRPNEYITDEAGFIGEATRLAINGALVAFEKRTKHEFRVLITKRRLPADPPREWCKDLFNAWQIGRKYDDDGVLLVIFTEDGSAPGRGYWWIATGWGTQRRYISDAEAEKIIRRVPGLHLDRGNPNSAVVATVRAIMRRMEP